MKPSFKQTLKAEAHALKPVVQIGAKGLTQAVIDEANQAILTHELIKIKMSGSDREQRQEMAEEICQQLKAELIQQIGNIAVIYRKKEPS